MARTRTTTTHKPSLMARLTGRNQHNTTTTTTTSTNPITGKRKTTRKTQTEGVGHNNHTHGHHNNTTTTHGVTGPAAAPHHHHQRKPSMGDKMSGAMMKLRGSLTGRPGVKAAGTRRMRGHDGKGAHHSAPVGAATTTTTAAY